MGIEIRLVGPVAMRGHDGVDRLLSSRQARVALVRLTLERARGTTRGELADTVWPELLPNTWGSALRTVVSRVRAFVESGLPTTTDPVVAQNGRYSLHLPADVTVDVELAEAGLAAAHQAIAAADFAEAYRLATDGVGCLRLPLLEDHDGDWVTRQREHLAEQLVTGLELASQAAIALGDAAAALVLANEAVLRAPLRESAHRQRMAAHAGAGNRSEALRAYQHLRRVLMEEVGVDPSPQTEAAYLDLLGPTSSGAGLSGEPQMAVTRGELSPFVGREIELAAIAEAWTGAVQRSRQVVLISGDAGVGKTRLALEAARQAIGEGALVLFGGCDPNAAARYQPFVEVIDGYVMAAPPDELPVLHPASCAALTAIIPAYPCAHGCQPTSDRLGLFDAVTRLLVRAASDRPVLVVLDDLQWADADTMLLVRHLLRHSRGTPLMVVAITRDDIRAPHPLADVERAFDCEGRMLRLPLKGVDEAEVPMLMRQVVPVGASAAGLGDRARVAESAGNPVMLVEFLRVVAHNDSSRESIAARLR